MNRRSLVARCSLYFGGGKKKSEKLPGKLENSGKTESAFFCGKGWNDLDNFFLNVRNNPYEVFM
jgi:hypothetical protein